MATKNLKRSVFEGGQLKHQQSRKRCDRRRDRQRIRKLLRQARLDPENTETSIAPSIMHKHWGWDRDHWSHRVVNLWLVKQVGRNWGSVYAELVRQFGRSYTKANLIGDVSKLTDYHSARSVIRMTGYYAHWNEFVIDEQGILRSADEFEQVA